MLPLRNSKRVNLPRAFQYDKLFIKDWDRLSHSGRYDMRRLHEAMILLVVNDAPLGAEWKDHALKGEWRDYRECHIGGDFLLIYRINSEKKIETLYFTRAGTHAELFE